MRGWVRSTAGTRPRRTVVVAWPEVAGIDGGDQSGDGRSSGSVGFDAAASTRANGVASGALRVARSTPVRLIGVKRTLWPRRQGGTAETSLGVNGGSG